MDQDCVARIAADPAYQTLIMRRGRLAGVLTMLMLVAYFGYVGLIAFDKAVLGAQIGGCVITVGIPVGLGLILFSVVLTGIYVVQANREFDRLTRDVVEAHTS